MQPPRQAKKACKKFWCPNPPNRGTATRREEGHILQGKTCVCRATQKQGSIVHSLRELANCSKLRKASVGWAEFKPQLRGSLEPSPSQQRTAPCWPPEGSWGPVPNPAAACWPLCKVSGSVDTVPEPSGCTQPPSLSSCDRRQAALSASGCECSLPEMAMKTCKKFGAPTHPTVAPGHKKGGGTESAG